MKFQILCLDSEELVKSKSVPTFMHALLANDKLFVSPTSNIENKEIIDSKTGIKILIEQYDTSNFVTGARLSLAYIVTVTSENEDILDEYRISIVDYIKELKFSNIRILVDEVSEKLACELYPTIYKLENKVRSFIVNFFIKNFGINWLELAVSKDVLEKISKRKDNDKIFVKSGKINSDVILMDFDDLGRIIYDDKSILSTRKIDNISILIEKVRSATSLEILKADVVEGNFYKYFKDCFTQKDFANKWYELYYYRNKTAHNSYFTKNEFETCTKLCEDISNTIDNAYEKLDTFKLSVTDMEAFTEAVKDIGDKDSDYEMNNFSDATSYIQHFGRVNRFKNIDEQTLLDELQIAANSLPFVGLKYFVIDILGQKNYLYKSSFAMINLLVDKGILSLSKIDNPNGEFATTFIIFSK